MIIPSISVDGNTKISAWTAKKRESLRVLRHLRLAAAAAESPAHERLKGRVERMGKCGNTVMYDVDNEGKYHYAGAWLCRDRLCPVCAWRLSVKRTAEMLATVAELARQEPDTKAIHIVLTVRNCPAEELGQVIRQITEGFSRLRKYQLWKDYILGYLRSVEVTYNAVADTYHPHIHVIAIVRGRYTRQISMGDWVSMWRQAARVNYNPVVWAEHAYSRAEPDLIMEFPPDETAGAAIVEACKYSLKSETILQIAAAGDLGIVAEALSGIRMVSYGGIIKRIRAELKMKDEPEGAAQLPEVTIDPARGLDRYRVIYEWCSRTRSYIQVSSEQAFEKIS